MATTPTAAASVDSIDEIANLLIDEETESEETSEPVLEKDEGEEAPDDEQVEESNEEPEEEESEEVDSELTWGSVLGVDDSKLVLNEDEQLEGVKVKVDGEESTVKLNELIAGYQNNKFNTQKSQALSQERKEFEALVQKNVDEYKSKVEAVDKLTQYLEKQFISEFEGVNWQQLRVENPAEYAALMQDYNVRQAEISRIKNAISSEKEELSEEDKQKGLEKQQALLQEQATKLIEKFPEWADQKVANEAFGEMGKFVTETYGFTPEEFAGAVDARLISMIQDALAYNKGKSMVSKKVAKPVPKFKKSTGRGRVSRPSSKLDRLTKAARSAKGANKRALQTDAIAELLISGDK